MKKLFLATALAALLMPVAAAAQSPFEGTWKMNLNNVNFPKKPDVYLLQNGMYSCKTCIPPHTIKADGMDQQIAGDPYIDTMAVEVVNDHEIRVTDKKNGKIVATATDILSPDGNTLTRDVSDSSATNGGPPVTSKSEEVRVAKGPAGSSLLSGSWRTTKIESVSDNGGVFTYRVGGDELTMTSPTGQTYTAKFNGPEAPMKGDPGTSSVQLKLIGKNTLEETDFRDGKVISVSKMTVAPDGKTADATVHDPRDNTTATFQLMKQ